ncbi:TRAP transporter small permease [Photobacterium sp. DNB23_23_1]
MSIRKYIHLANDNMVKPIIILMCMTVCLIALLTLISIVVRNFMGFSFQWVMDVNRLLFVWMCFLGLIYANYKDALIRFDFMDNKFPPKINNVIVIGRHVGCIALFIIMIKAGFEIIDFAKHQEFPTIPLSMASMYYAVVFSGVFLVIQTTLKLIDFLIVITDKGKYLNLESRHNYD